MTLNPRRLDELTARAQLDIDEGILPGCQMAVALADEVIWSVSLGTATPASRYAVFSCTKALIAGVMWQLFGEGVADPAERVTTYFPEFGDNGKQDITVEMLLTHTGGFPTAPLGPPNWIDRDWRVQQMARWRLNWEPGTRFEYHPTSAHWVLGEIIARLDGVDTTESVRRRILEPLGLTRLAFGVPAADQGDIADLVLGGSPLSQAELEATFGPGFSLGEVTPEVLLGFNEPTAREVGMPGGGAVSDAADLAMYYQALLHNTKGLWNAEMLSDGTGNIRCVLPDPLTGVPANRTLGLVVAGDDGKSAFRGFGHTVGPRTFGHNGAAGQIAFADPDTGMSFVYLTNGIDQDFLREARRGVSLASRAGRLLSLDE